MTVQLSEHIKEPVQLSEHIKETVQLSEHIKGTVQLSEQKTIYMTLTLLLKNVPDRRFSQLKVKKLNFLLDSGNTVTDIFL